MPTLDVEPTEKLLIKQLRSGDYEAFNALYGRYKIRLIGTIFKLVKSEEMAKDILQDLFLKVWEMRESLDPEKSFRSYLFRICENLVYDQYRKLARDKKMQQHFIQFSQTWYRHVEETVAGKEMSVQINDALESLPPQCKKVFILFKVEGKSYKEISEQLGISKSTVNNHLYKANNLLGTRFKEIALICSIIVFFCHL